MAQALSLSPSPPLRPSSTLRDARFPSPSSSAFRVSASVSPPPTSSSSRPRTKRRPSATKENEPLDQVKPGAPMADYDHLASPAKSAKAKAKEPAQDMGNGGGRAWRDGSVGIEDEGELRQRKNPPRSVRSSKSPSTGPPASPYNGLPTLPTVFDESAPSSPTSASRPPPPASSAGTGAGERPVTRKRRSSSIKRKPSPGVTPTNVVDWEIPRKALHSSIGFLTLFLHYLDPPSLRPLITVLSSGLVVVLIADFFRLRYPAFAEVWEAYLGFLMRESERDKINGVVWYLIGVVWVLGIYPRDVAVVSILTLSWSDTTASTIGRLWGRYTPPLPSHFPGIKLLPFAPRKSLAGFLAATVTGALICFGFWHNGSGGTWEILDGGLGSWGLPLTGVVVGVGGAVVEALDLGLDDNLTLPILSGAIIWLWLGVTNLVLP